MKGHVFPPPFKTHTRYNAASKTPPSHHPDPAPHAHISLLTMDSREGGFWRNSRGDP